MSTLLIAGCLLAGVAIGRLWPSFPLVGNEDVIVNVLLYAMLFLVGLDLGTKGNLRAQIRRIGMDAILLPLLIAIGSILGGQIAGRLLGMDDWQGAAVGAGFGWYSLSGVLLSRVDVVLGAEAFLCNVIREILTLLLAPLLVRRLHPWAAIAAGGATAMDTTLPVVAKHAGSQYAIHSFLSGVILSMMVPFAISAILTIAGVN